MSHKILKRKKLRQGSTACSGAGIPRCRGRAGTGLGLPSVSAGLPGAQRWGLADLAGRL